MPDQRPEIAAHRQRPAAKIAASIPRDRLYRVSQPFCSVVQSLQFHSRALRVLHGLLHATCQEAAIWHDPYTELPGLHRLSCRELRRRLGLGGEDNRLLAAGLEELMRSGLFDVLGFRNDNRWLEWRMTFQAHDWFFAEPHEGYGYFDIADIPNLRTSMDFHIHDQLGVRRAQTRPGPEVALCLADTPTSWERLRRPLILALQRSAALYHCRFLVLLECRGHRIGVDQITIRMRLPHTRWGNRILKRSSPSASPRGILLVDAARCEDVGVEGASDRVQAFFATSRKAAA
jgi:hypothetical protein